MSKYNEFMIARMAVLGCHRNPQAHTTEECCKCDFKQGMCDAYRMAEDLYENGFEPVVHAHWIGKDSVIENFYTCSACGSKELYMNAAVYQFCPHCGAKMDEEVKE